MVSSYCHNRQSREGVILIHLISTTYFYKVLLTKISVEGAGTLLSTVELYTALYRAVLYSCVQLCALEGRDAMCVSMNVLNTPFFSKTETWPC